jgi:nuclear transport factor 2 (NTF2) superfamily protein
LAAAGYQGAALRKGDRLRVNPAEGLKSAAAGHGVTSALGVHKKELGRPDPDWPQWYAGYITRTLSGIGDHLPGPSARCIQNLHINELQCKLPHIAKRCETEIAKGDRKMSSEPKIISSPVPPFTRDTGTLKVRLIEDKWNSRNPEELAKGYSENSFWRNRSEFLNGRADIVAFLERKWAKELDYRLIKELWAFDGNRLAVRFAYEWHDDSGQWYRSYGNENWEFDENGLMLRRFASINDLPIREPERKYHWPLGRRPDGHPGLSDLGL